MREGRNLRMDTGVILPPTALARRPKITLATRPLSCWYMIDFTRVSKSGFRNSMRYSPTRSMIPESTGSACLRCSMASFMSLKRLCERKRHPYCTGTGMRTLVVFALAAALAAQTPPKGKTEDDALAAIKVDVDVVSILASVRDKRGGLVGNLEKNDFTVLEDGKQQSIKYFTRETDLPLTIGLLIDVSRSQENLIDIERRAAAAFFAQVLQKKDEAFLISFGEESELLQDYTDRKSTRLNSSHLGISYAVFCLKKKNKTQHESRMCIYRAHVIALAPCRGLC